LLMEQRVCHPMDNIRFELGDKLTAEQLDFFNTHGYLHFKDFIKPETVKLFIEESEKIQENLISKNITKINGVPLKFGTDIDGKKIIQRFAFTSQQSEIFKEFILDPRFRILFPLLGDDAVNPRVGENEKDGMVLNHYINTDASKFTQMGWHTDCLRDVFYGKKIMPMLNVGIHLTNAVPNNGGLRIIPGTHQQGLFNLLFKKPYFLDNRPDKNEIGLVTKAGDLTVHDGRLWHRVAKSSLIGEGSRRRVIYIPVISGNYAYKHEKSPTVFYHRLQGMVR
jgi:ectoine hydroxylase-related dioxygenase (phytanoyl-CoA dioxygenase family)